MVSKRFISGAILSLSLNAGCRRANTLEEVLKPTFYELYKRDLTACNAKASEEKTKRLFELEVSAAEICSPEETPKPNALLIYPLSDHNGTFYSDYQRTFVNNIKSVYDTDVLIAEDYHELNAALWSKKKVDLLVISGHGSESGIQLGNKSSDAYSPDPYILYDYKLDNSALDNILTENGTLFLNSCQQGLYFDFYFHSNNKRTIISSYDNFGIDKVQVSSWYPLKLKIIVDDKDTTKIELR